MLLQRLVERIIVIPDAKKSTFNGSKSAARNVTMQYGFVALVLLFPHNYYSTLF